ncbi:MAG: sigma-70 family RNA polymerase sigma factor [Polyangiaceae bacterium]
MTAAIGSDFFRREYARLVAMLVRRVGAHRLEAIEDAVQGALLAAVETWPRGALPDNPSAWLSRVAHHHLVSELRTRGRRDRLAAEHFDTTAAPSFAEPPDASLAGEIRDDLLRMLFLACDDAIPVESQIVLALKTLSGFGVREIAERLFLSEANVYKRLQRAQARLRITPPSAEALTFAELTTRLPAVLAILHAIFTEGHLSSHAEGPVRRELCEDARWLASVLVDHPAGRTPATYALLALMDLHLARLSARQDPYGALLLLDEQDRSRWDAAQIQSGLAWLGRAAEGDLFSRYHAEAGIAAEHCIAGTMKDTRWDRVVACYELLDRVAPSPLHTLNRAIAVAEWRGPEAALAVIEGLDPPEWIRRSYVWPAVLSDLHRRAGQGERARALGQAALVAAPSDAIRAALERRLTMAR